MRGIVPPTPRALWTGRAGLADPTGAEHRNHRATSSSDPQAGS